jgi:concentrative nucleoside transporter, CNT family
MHTFQSIVGIFGLLALSFVISENRHGLGLTVAPAVLLLKIPQLKFAFSVIGDAANAVAAASRACTSFVFGQVDRVRHALACLIGAIVGALT